MLSVREIVSILHRISRYDRWFFSLENAAFFTGRKADEALLSDLHHYVNEGLLEFYGERLFGFDIPSMKPWNCQEIIALQLRTLEFNYLSFEYQLNQFGIISQIPTIMTVATTGKSGLCQTKTMRIEFIHVDRPYQYLFEVCHFSEARGIFEASPLLALEDLQALGRNTHLIDDNSIEEAVNDYTGYIQKQQN